MIVVIIAGGSGTRLWPLSTPDFPKHLLAVSGEETLIQSAYNRAKTFADHVYVVTEIGHADKIRAQLPELKDDAFVVEPARRGTINCLLAGLHRVQTAGHDLDEPIVFAVADHFIRDVDSFTQSFRLAGEVSQQQKAITLVGFEPTYPATGMGYIQKGKPLAGNAIVHWVKSFKEKPTFDVAQEYLRSGDYLWNGSYFVASVNVFVDVMKQFNPALKANYDKLLATKDEAAFKKLYLSFKTDTIDYALSEKVDTERLLVVSALFDWMDVGSFKEFHDAVESDERGNHARGNVELEEVENSLVRNEEKDKPVAVIGLDNVVVINTPNGVLIARKDLAQKVKDIVQRLQDKKS